MSRYIEYEPLMAELEREVELADDWKTAHEIANVVKYAPSIDIVFCKECKYEKRCTTNVHFLADNGLDVIPVRFCSYGEREGEPLDYCKKRNCVWWSRSLRICLAEQNGLVCKCKSGKE